MNGNPEQTQAGPEPPASEGFRAVLTPHRSLGPTGFRILMIALGAISLVTGTLFLALGAWPGRQPAPCA